MIRFLQTQSRSGKLLLGVILILVIFSMVAYLGNAFLGTSATANAQGIYAVVGDAQITVLEINETAQYIRRTNYPGGFPDAYLPFLQRQAANTLVLQAALNEEARRLGLKVTDEEMRGLLRQGQFGQQLFPNGKFVGAEAYAQFVSSLYNLSIPVFERKFKEEVLRNKLQALIESGAAVLPAEVEQEFLRQNVKVKFDYALVDFEKIARQVTVSDAELRAFYEKNKAQLENTIPEQRKIRYVVVDTSKIPVRITEEDYKRAYARRQDEFKTPEQVDVRHILVKTKAQAEEIIKQLNAGAKFEGLAKKYSEDPGSKNNGGLYKNVLRGKMVPAFDQAAFSLEKGKISEPVETNFGFHVIRVDDHRAAVLRPLEQVKSQLEVGIRAEKAAQELEALADAVKNDARKDGLDKAAAAHGLALIPTDFVSQSATLPGMGASSLFMSEIFSMPPKSPAEKIRLDNGVAVAEVVDVKPPSTPTFEQARTQLEQQFRNQRASELLGKKTQELADRARSLHDLKRAAKELGATLKASDFVTPSGQVADIGPMTGQAAVVFTMKPGQISDPIPSGRNGIVIALTGRQEPNPSELGPQKDQIREQMLRRKREEIFAGFVTQLRTHLEKEGAIKINATEQQRLESPAGS